VVEAVLGTIAWYVIKRRRGKGKDSKDVKVEESGIDADADVQKRFLTPTPGDKMVPLVPAARELRKEREQAVHDAGESQLLAEMAGTRDVSELDGNETGMSETQRVKWVDDRAAAGYERAYRGN
jgi:hypothetical protein